jgi:hypothetical protein
MTCKIFQIFYSQETKNQIDPAFIALDNTENARPDWREYWPIKKWFSENHLNDEYCGFFSPKFASKTGLDGKKVLDFASSNNADVISLSPFIDQSAFFLNIFEQGEANHPGLLRLMQEITRKAGHDAEISTLCNSNERFIFSNFFVANKSFWRKWNEIMDIVFTESENNNTALGNMLNRHAPYKRNEQVHYKVFAMERIASLVLNLFPELTVAAYPVFSLPTSGLLRVPHSPAELAMGNALKYAYNKTKEEIYISSFYRLRNEVGKRASTG